MKFEKITLNEITPSEYNPRIMSGEETEKLTRNLKEFGLVDPIIINLKNNRIIGGHQRYNVLQKDKTNKKKKFNLIRLGDIGWVFEDENLEIKDENHEKALNIALNKISGEWDFPKLEKLFDELGENKFDIGLTGFDINVDALHDSFSEMSFIEQNNSLDYSDSEEKEDEFFEEDSLSNEPAPYALHDFEQYSQKIETPIYEMKGESPEISELYDNSKTKHLIDEIKNSNIPPDQKDFLISAANRLTVFNYSKIAEYYAHQNKDVQELMEKLILVIIDFDKAVEEGYVALRKEYIELVKSFE